MHFKDRKEAGQKLAKELVKKYKDSNVVVYALPRGGVALGAVIAKELDASLDLVITRKIGHPMQPEYAVCAVGESGGLVCSEFEKPSLDQDWLDEQVKKEREEAKRRREVYLPAQAGMKGKEISATKDTIAIIVDDGVATGLTMEAAIDEIASKGVKHIVVAVPVLPPEAAEKFNKKIDNLVALDIPKVYLGAVGAYYSEFPQLEDEEVIKILESYRAE